MSKRKSKTADVLPPGVDIWPDNPDDPYGNDGHEAFPYALVERIPFSPSRFVLARYRSRQAAEADAWESVSAHGAKVQQLGWKNR